MDDYPRFTPMNPSVESLVARTSPPAPLSSQFRVGSLAAAGGWDLRQLAIYGGIVVLLLIVVYLVVWYYRKNTLCSTMAAAPQQPNQHPLLAAPSRDQLAKRQELFSFAKTTDPTIRAIYQQNKTRLAPPPEIIVNNSIPAVSGKDTDFAPDRDTYAWPMWAPVFLTAQDASVSKPITSDYPFSDLRTLRSAAYGDHEPLTNSVADVFSCYGDAAEQVRSYKYYKEYQARHQDQ